MYANAGVLFLNAVASRQAAASLNAASQEAQRGHLASLIFAAISAEAFINEIGQLAAESRSHLEEPNWVEKLGKVLTQSEESKTPPKFKYDLAKLVLTGDVFDKGSQPFQDFSLLMDLRNLVVHTKPMEAVREKEAHSSWKWKNPIARFQGWGIDPKDGLIPQYVAHGDAAQITSNFLAEISSQTVAVKACEATAGVVNAILDAVPTSPRFKSLLESIYRKDFQLTKRKS